MGCRARGRGAESNPTLRQAGEAEAATLTEAEASPGEAAAPGSASCLAGAALVLEEATREAALPTSAVCSHDSSHDHMQNDSLILVQISQKNIITWKQQLGMSRC